MVCVLVDIYTTCNVRENVKKKCKYDTRIRSVYTVKNTKKIFYKVHTDQPLSLSLSTHTHTHTPSFQFSLCIFKIHTSRTFLSFYKFKLCAPCNIIISHYVYFNIISFSNLNHPNHLNLNHLNHLNLHPSSN